MSASDEKIIDATARFWIDQGGDEEGIVWCWQSLRKKVADIIEEQQHGKSVTTRADTRPERKD